MFFASWQKISGADGLQVKRLHLSPIMFFFNSISFRPGHFWKTKHPLNILSSELTMNSKLKTKVWKIRAEVLLWNYQPWLSIGQGLILQMSLNLEFWAIGILASNQNYPVLILEIFWVLFFCCCCWCLLCLFWGCQEVNTMLKDTSEIPQSLGPESLWLLYCTQLFSDVSYITWLPHTKLWRNSGISAEFCTPKEWKGLLTFCLQMQASKKLKTFFWSLEISIALLVPKMTSNVSTWRIGACL